MKHIPAFCLALSALAAVVNGGSIRDNRIVHGRVAELDEAQYQIGIRFKDWHTNQVFCGGVLVADRICITAAHCLQSVYRAEQIEVILGAHNRMDDGNPVFDVDHVIKHPYNDRTKVGDVGMLVLKAEPKKRAHDNKHNFKPIAIIDKNFDLTNKMCSVSGWGYLASDKHIQPHALQIVDVKVLGKDQCKRMLDQYAPGFFNKEAMMCAGGLTEDACQGDSGGPIVCKNDNGEDVVAGVVSWGIGCATRGAPGVYTELKTYLDWITTNMERHRD